ncbi:ABC transporter ATP-binding protein [Fredinandcohnia aciditolerans]|uniref:ABC transporter ATP-binding protein n=1 Tax=Ferdinandcohnia sp. SAFN-114 TaxID=3387275 RepID=UPI000EAFB238
MSHTLQTKNLHSGYDQNLILKDVNLSIPKNKISIIIGSNGCGKSTLLKTMARLLKPSDGDVYLDNKSIYEIPSKKLARTVGLLPQSPIVPEGITVADLVGRGRFPHQSMFSSWSKKDYEAVATALDMMNIAEFSDRHIDELSGGQRQRVWIAMALAQQTDILFLDEPTTYLDITYQVEILDLLKDLNEKYGTTIVMVLHDINLSARYADYLFAVKNGKLIAEGSPNDIITSELIKETFNLDCHIINDPISNTPLVLPISRFHK